MKKVQVSASWPMGSRHLELLWTKQLIQGTAGTDYSFTEVSLAFAF